MITLVRTNSQLDADQQAAAAAALEPAPVISGLATHIHNAFEAARLHKDLHVTANLMACKRAYLGQYPPELLAAIKAAGGSEMYFNATATKCKGAEAWLRDITATAGERPWKLEATPVPDLPDSVKERVAEQVMARFAPMLPPGADRTPEIIEQIKAYTDEMREAELKALKEEAATRADRAADIIEDQLAEGGFDEALSHFLRDLTIYPLAILMGPEMRKERRLQWEGSTPVMKFEEVPRWRRVSPFDFFPAPNVRKIDEGYVCERGYITLAELANMRGATGWDSAAIDRVIATRPAANVGQTGQGESERAAMEHRDQSTNGGYAVDVQQFILFWGWVQGSLLAEWNIPVQNQLDFVAIKAIKIGNEVVMAIANPDPLGRAPYYVAKYREDPDSLWGQALPEAMEDCQTGINACLRNMINNLAWAAGPMAALDKDFLPPNVPAPDFLQPCTVIAYSGASLQTNRKIVDWFQPDSHTAEFQQVADYFENKADERTLIPKYSYGDQDVGGAAATATGLNMLMGAAGRGIKALLASIDAGVFKPLIYAIYVWNCLYHPERERFAGDCRVVTRGAMELLVREHTNQLRQNFLQATANPLDMQIIGLLGRAKLLRAIATGLQIPVDEIVPPDQEIIARAQQAQIAAPEPATGQTMDKEAA